MNHKTNATQQQNGGLPQGKADLHMHTLYSDGTASVEAVLAQVVTHTDLRVIAITDHDTIEGALAARRLAPSYGVEVIIGEEVSTAEGHLLALFIADYLPPGRPAAETIAAIHAQGGLAFAAHPYDWMAPSLGRRDLCRRSAGPAPEWPLDGLETFNASLWRPRDNERAESAARALGLAAIGGSDAHHLATIGRGYTLFPGQTAEALRTAIRQRRVWPAGSYRSWKAVVEGISLWLQLALNGQLSRLATASGTAQPQGLVPRRVAPPPARRAVPGARDAVRGLLRTVTPACHGGDCP